tara:strand:+ start:143 stop:460 length:318 start_codon:yes stop_codon:yes gene_type:complete
MPAMSQVPYENGATYALTYTDSTGNAFNRSKAYELHVPIESFWSFALYDNRTRSMLQTDQQFLGIDSNEKDRVKNAVGSYDIYFRPSAPMAGEKGNWLQTAPDKS